jgi:hypothetical protein
MFVIFRTMSLYPLPEGAAALQVCPKGLNPGKAIAKIKQSVHSGHAI